MPQPGTVPHLRIGIDLGGTKIEGLLLDTSGAEIRRRRIPSPTNDYQSTIRAVTDLVAYLLADIPQEEACHATVGVGMPGSLCPRTGLVQNANSTWLNGKPFDRDLAAAFNRPLRVANDANCFALSEATDGAGKGASCVFGVILGTGVGGAIIYRNQIIVGPRAIAGEWGHNPLPWPTADEFPGPRCWCGRHGCLETWLSGPAMAADHRRMTGETMTAEDIARLAEAGHAASAATLQRHASRLARGLAHVINIVDPDVIVLGGGLSQMPHLYRTLPGLIAPHVFADATEIDVRPPRWGDAGGARGAAWLWQ